MPTWMASGPGKDWRLRSLRASAPCSAIFALTQARAPFGRRAPPDRRTQVRRDAKNKQRPREFDRAQVSSRRSSQSPSIFTHRALMMTVSATEDANAVFLPFGSGLSIRSSKGDLMLRCLIAGTSALGARRLVERRAQPLRELHGVVVRPEMHE